MNLKYYLRGLGLGIVITAVLLGITAGSRKETLTDEEIIVKAKDLGMIEESELAGYIEEARSDAETELRAAIEGELQNSLREEIRAELEAELALQQPAAEELPAEPQEASAMPEEGTEPDTRPEPIEFTVNVGELAGDISSRLEQAGLVESASEFEKFLIGNGYDRSIVAYKYSIPAEASEEEIARILTGNP